MAYPKPYSIYLRGTIKVLTPALTLLRLGHCSFGGGWYLGVIVIVHLRFMRGTLHSGNSCVMG